MRSETWFRIFLLFFGRKKPQKISKQTASTIWWPGPNPVPLRSPKLLHTFYAIVAICWLFLSFFHSIFCFLHHFLKLLHASLQDTLPRPHHNSNLNFTAPVCYSNVIAKIIINETLETPWFPLQWLHAAHAPDSSAQPVSCTTCCSSATQPFSAICNIIHQHLTSFKINLFTVHGSIRCTDCTTLNITTLLLHRRHPVIHSSYHVYSDLAHLSIS